MFDYTDVHGLAANYPSVIVRLSPDSLALFLSTEDLTEIRSWLVSGEKPDATQADTIEAMVAQAYYELMVNPMLGTIQPFVTSSAPEGMLECDGSTQLRTDYPALYAVLDAAFITDADHFTLPDLRGRTLIGAGAGSGLTVRAVGDTGGEETHVLTTAELAAHTHTSQPHLHGTLSHNHNYVPAVAALGAALVGVPIPSAVPGVALTGGATVAVQNATNVNNNAGSDTAHQNMSPFLALRYGIWTI